LAVAVAADLSNIDGWLVLRDNVREVVFGQKAPIIFS